MGGLFPRNETARVIISIILTIFAILFLVPFMIFATGLLLCIRGVLNWYKNRWKPELGELLSRSNSVFAMDDPHGANHHGISSCITLDGHLSLEELITVMQMSVDNFNKDGIYPELQQELTTWMGFSVWKNIKDFNVKKHIKVLDPNLLGEYLYVDDDNVMEILGNIRPIPFDKHQSPWEWLVTYDVKMDVQKGRPKTYLIGRWHHSLGDAMSFLQCVSDGLGGPDLVGEFVKKVTKNNKTRDKTGVEKFLYVLTFPFLGLYEFCYLFIRNIDSHAWHSLRTPMRNDLHFATAVRTTKQEIKQICLHRGNLKFYTVMLAALTGAIRKFMIKNGVTVPMDMSVGLVIPIPSKKKQLSNDVSALMYSMPVGWNNREDIITSIEHQQEVVKNSRFPFVFYLVLAFLGLLPRIINCTKMCWNTCASSNFPGFEQDIKFGPVNITNIIAMTKVEGTCGIYYYTSGWKDKVQISLGAATDIIETKEQMNELCGFVAEEIQVMKNPLDNEIISSSFLQKIKSN